MKLVYFRGEIPNFGDELNVTMWDNLLPGGFLDDDPAELFIGIGSIINDDYPKTARKIVVGAGYGGYTPKPDVHDGSWDFRFVRGPQTAEALGIEPDLAIADSAVLLRATPLPPPASGIDIGFIPHFESLERGHWPEVCRLAGVRLIDPTKPTDEVIAEIRGARLLITEAMHGAIVADALRTPWIAVRTMHSLHRYKWFDWARSLDIDYRPAFLFPSNGREAWAAATGRSGSGPRARRLLAGRGALPLNAAIHHVAARSIQKLARRDPQLSSDAAIERATDLALSAVDRLVKQRRAAQPVPVRI
ncbi:MAG: polysaccharide pyruvyl transferase family protein [Paracoccaceae bacterium]